MDNETVSDDEYDARIEAVLPRLEAAIAHQQAGRLDEAEALYTEVLAEVPDLDDALHLLGQVALARRDFPRAIELIAKALETLPEELAEPHVNLGSAFAGAGRHAEAVNSFQRALLIDPGIEVAAVRLARSLGAIGQHESALAVCLQFQPRHPRCAELHLQAGLSLRRLRLPVAAEKAFRNAIALDPNNRPVHGYLSSLLLELKQYEQAQEIDERALAQWPDEATVLATAANTLFWLHDHRRARELAARSVAVDPGFARGWMLQGEMERICGDFAAAERCFQRALELAPDMPEAKLNLMINKRQASDAPEIATMRAKFFDKATSAAERMTTGYALGKTLDDADRFEEAFPVFAEANALFKQQQTAQGKRYDPVSFGNRMSETIRETPSDYFDALRGWGNPSDLPVFIVGMPRSGTTLMEQIAASHSRVHGAGELSLLRDIGRELALFNASKPSVPQWDAAHARRLADKHVERLQALGGGAARVIDKLPDNMLLVHLIRALFPNARIIYAKRDPRDCVISNFFQYYTYGNLFACDLEHCGLRARDTARLGEHWRQVIPGAFMQLDYESLVADLEGQARGLIEFLGLDWEPACLDFHRTQRDVSTPSNWQVRQPIYTRSVGRWQHYEAFLGPLFAALAAPVPE